MGANFISSARVLFVYGETRAATAKRELTSGAEVSFWERYKIKHEYKTWRGMFTAAVHVRI